MCDHWCGVGVKEHARRHNFLMCEFKREIYVKPLIVVVEVDIAPIQSDYVNSMYCRIVLHRYYMLSKPQL